MNRIVIAALFAVTSLTSAGAFAAAGGQGQNCEQGAVNQNFCGGDGGTGGGDDNSTTTTDNSQDNDTNFNNDYSQDNDNYSDFNNDYSQDNSDNSYTDKSDNSYTDNSTTNIDKSTNGPTHNGDKYVDNSNTAEGGQGGQGGKGGKGGDGGDASVGDTTSKSKSNSSATGGNASAKGGDASATGGSVGDTSSRSESNNTNDNTSSVGDTTSESNNSNSNDSEGGDVEFNYSYNNVQAENAASSAASVLTGFCQTGGSGQGFNGGFTLTGNDQFCDRIRMADYYWVQYGRQKEIAATFQCHKVEKDMPLYERCIETGERMFESLDLAWENTEEANQLLDTGKFAANVEKATGPLARIGGILAVLILL